jgi:hypothetical protein
MNNIPKTALNVVLFQAGSGRDAVHPHPVLAGGGPGHEKLLQVQHAEYAQKESNAKCCYL